jgi:hypothetical protein
MLRVLLMSDQWLGFTLYRERGEEAGGFAQEVDVRLPAVWVICSTCRGNGKHSLALGAISAEDFEREWDEDERADYMNGAYDQPCQPCGALGRVLEVNREACSTTPLLVEALEQFDERAAEDAADMRMMRAECGEF